MIPRLLACWLLLAALMGAVASPNADPWGLQPVIEAMRLPGVETTVKWAPCGEANAFYVPRSRTVYLCRELLSEPTITPAVLRFILAHELAHGVIVQRDIPYTGSGEAAADELAAFIMGLYGMDAELLLTGQWWLDRNHPEIPWDDHPSDARRGYTLACLSVGVTGAGPAVCTNAWLTVERHWMRLLGL